jgi:hypothetical protein
MGNKMSALLDKVERRLGTRPLNLPEHLRKDNWAKIIEQDTLPTFSRFFPDKITTFIDGKTKKDGYYFIDEKVAENYEILGVRDIEWKSFARDGAQTQTIWGYYDIIGTGYGLDDIALLSARADCTSLFNNGIYLTFKKPNMIRLETVSGIRYDRIEMGFPVELFVQHLPNLMTIPPTKMEVFEQLSMADIATFLFNELKYYNDLETIFANVNIRLDTIEEKANQRADIVNRLEENFVSAANTNQPIMYTV